MYILYSRFDAAQVALAAQAGEGDTVIDWMDGSDAGRETVMAYMDAGYPSPRELPALVDEETGTIVNGAEALSDLDDALAVLPVSVDVEIPSGVSAIIRADGTDSVTVRFAKAGASSVDVEMTTALADGTEETETVTVTLDADGEGALEITADEPCMITLVPAEGGEEIKVKAV